MSNREEEPRARISLTERGLRLKDSLIGVVRVAGVVAVAGVAAVVYLDTERAGSAYERATEECIGRLSGTPKNLDQHPESDELIIPQSVYRQYLACEEAGNDPDLAVYTAGPMPVASPDQ